jgi:hypothetical protein
MLFGCQVSHMTVPPIGVLPLVVEEAVAGSLIPGA